MSRWQRTGVDYIPTADHEPYYPQGKPDNEVGEKVKILKSGTDSSLIEDSSGDTRVVPNSWLRRG